MLLSFMLYLRDAWQLFSPKRLCFTLYLRVRDSLLVLQSIYQLANQCGS